MKTEDFEKLKKLCNENGFKAEYRVEKDKVMVLVEKKRVKVELDWIGFNKSSGQFHFLISNNQEIPSVLIGEFLVKQLEKYLNGEIK